MALYTKKEFAELCKQATNYLSVNIKRGKVICVDDKIDSENLTNKLYLEKIYGRMDFVPGLPVKPTVQPQLPIFSPKGADKDEDPLSDEDMEKIKALYGGMDYPTLEKIYKYRQGEKLKSDIEKNGIEVQKKKGELIPAAPIVDIVFQLKQYWITHSKIAFEKALMEIGHKYELTSEDLAYFRGNNTKLINDAMVASSQEFKNNLDGILFQYSTKRGVGERL